MGKSEPLLDDEEFRRRFAEGGRGLSSAELEGIQAALEAVHRQGQELQEFDGLSQWSFFLGVLNVPFLCLTLAWVPEYLWLAYLAESFILIPAWFMGVIKVYNGALYVLDFCWMANIGFAIYLLLLLLNVVPNFLRDGIFFAYFACALGPLGWACIVLHNGLIFHSAQKIASVFIHMCPAYVAWTVVMYPEKLEATWPGRFPTRNVLESASLLEIYCWGFGLYICWWILHSIWLLTCGLHCPERGLSTVFDGLYTGKNWARLFEKWTGLKSLRSHAAIYLFFHCIGSAVAFAWSLLCFHSKIVHTIFAASLFLSAAWSGAGYYEYVMAKKYTKVVKKVLETKHEQRATKL